MKQMTFATLIATMLLLSMGLDAVGAAPVNNPHSLQFEAECEGIGSQGFIEPPSNVVGFVVGSTQRTIIHEVDYVIAIEVASLAEPVEIPVSETLGEGQKNGVQDRLVNCSFSDVELPLEIFTDADWDVLGIDLADVEGISASGTAEVMLTPARP
jgi:hypothetical protein